MHVWFVCIPNAVRKRKTSPSLQNMSHTLQATSRGSVLVYRVNILQDVTTMHHNPGMILLSTPLTPL